MAQAEDVMGSLFKEYLGAPTDASPKAFLNSNGNSKKAEDVSADSKDDTVAKLEADHGKENGEQEKDITDSSEKMEVSSAIDVELTAVLSSESKEQGHPFKNVVAIVDPPRVGLHPTVSSI
jgi:tRNA (uracil-5-)-methyltransferase